MLLRHLHGWVPRWWRGEAGLAGAAADAFLWPAETIFRAGVALRNRSYDVGLLPVERAPIPVVSIGNIGVGGAGKTPFSAWVAARLEEWGHRPALVLRGYGADEILVHRELNPEIPVFAAPRRTGAVREAAESGCDVAVLDDAFQHRALARDLDLVLVAADGWGRPLRLLPRGPWREDLRGLERADLVVVTRKTAPEAVADEVEALVSGRLGPGRVVRCRLEMRELVRVRAGGAGEEHRSTASLRGSAALAVASLADPRPFVAALEAVGAKVELAAFPDHHRFTAEEAAGLADRAGDRPLIMTRKEAVKLRPLLNRDTEAWMVEQGVVVERGGSLLDDALRSAVEQ